MSSEAAQKAGGGAMSTRDELERFVDSFNGDEAGDIDWVYALDGNTGYAMRGGNDVESVLNKARDALIAEGWRKKPSRDEVARAIAWGVDGVDGEQFDEAAVDYRLEMLQGADAVLALMDRGQ